VVLTRSGVARLKLAVALVVVMGGVGLVALGTSHAAGASAGARMAHVVSVQDEGHLHSVRESGSDLTEEGPVAGTIPGRVKVNFNIGPTVSASFTIYASGGGSISGRGKGALHSTSKYATFGGTLTVTGGTGRYAHAHGSGGLYGAINRKTYALTVQTVGKLYY
jgi:hypothetical protein